jgi:hypothetical protein
VLCVNTACIFSTGKTVFLCTLSNIACWKLNHSCYSRFGLESGNCYEEDDFMDREYTNYKEKINKSANGQSDRELLGQSDVAAELS